MKSTVPVGTGDKVRAALEARGLGHVAYVSNPEFLAEGTALRDFMQPDRVVVGAYSEADLRRGCRALRGPRHRGRADRRPLGRDDQARLERVPRDADQLHQRDRERLRGDAAPTSMEVARGMGLDRRIGPHFLRAGIGYGGSCFPKDVSALKQLAGNSGYHFQLLNSVIEVNELQKRRVVGKLKKHLGHARGEAHRAARPRVQGRHRRPARGGLDRARRAPARRGRRGHGVGSGRRRRATSCAARRSATRRSRPSRVPTRP